MPRPVPQATNENDEVLAAKNANKVICCGWLSGVCLAAVQSHALRRICSPSLGRQLQRQAIDKPVRAAPLPPAQVLECDLTAEDEPAWRAVKKEVHSVL